MMAEPAAAQPLAGVRVVVTRAREQAAGMVRQFAELGATPVELPMIETVGIQSDELDLALTGLDDYDWMVFTSSNAVRFVIQRMRELKLPATSLANGPRVAAIGRATGRSLKREGIPVALIPEEAVAESLVRALVDRGVSGRRLLLPVSRIARSVLPSGLRQAGAAVDVIPVYDTRPPETVDPERVELVRRGEVDIVTFASPSAARHFRQIIGSDLAPSICVACIGPVTSGAAREAGLRVDVEPDDHSVPGLIDAIVAEHSCGWRKRTYERR